MADLLIELFSEEIPARLQARGAADLKRLMTTKLKDAGLEWESAETHYGPRRLTLVMRGLPEASPDTREERKGPKVGAPEKAIEGFLRGAGLSDISEAQVQETKKGEVYVAIIETKGRPTGEVVAEALGETIQNFPWPKSQRWGDGDLKWVRPLRSIILTLGGEPVSFHIENGSQPITAGTETGTHRVLGQGTVSASTTAAYEAALTEGCVVLRAEDRRARILDGANALCRDAGFELVEDKGLLDEVTGLAEWPTAYLGSFDEKFLTLPDEVITAAMRGHQKYFSVRDPKTGRLAPRFIAVADIDAGEGMLKGYERVLTARLSDALFLYQNDLKKPLEEHGKKLAGTTFFEGLGSLARKVEHVAALARELAPACGADRDKAEKAARLAKADLASEMVYEFPELQGLMGRYYALEQGVDGEIADAIRDHYKPAGQSDDLPTNPIGVAVSLADKLDTLAAFWSIGKKPTGSGDPFALRRAALAVIRQVLEYQLKLNLEPVFFECFAAFLLTDDGIPQGISLVEWREEKKRRHARDLLAFFHDRLTVYFRDQGYKHDHIAAVLEEDADDFVLVEKKLKALSAFLGTAEGENLTAAYKRAANILKAEAKKGDLPTGDVDPLRFAQDEERDLHAALETAENAAESAIKAEDFTAAMAPLADVRTNLDRFFENVTVNADDAALRENRLAQLLRLQSVVKRVADFDQLEG